MPSIDPGLQWALTFLATALAVVITWRQFRISKKQFGFQFREKRLAVYEAVRTLIALAVTNGTVTQEEWNKFGRDTKEAPFLFDGKIEAYCKKLHEHAVEVGIAHQVMETPSSPHYTLSVEKWSKGMEWFTDQHKEAEKLFKTYLQVRD